jgi:hypothetical protein
MIHHHDEKYSLYPSLYLSFFSVQLSLQHISHFTNTFSQFCKFFHFPFIVSLIFWRKSNQFFFLLQVPPISVLNLEPYLILTSFCSIACLILEARNCVVFNT